jgi:hypothetical protein
MGIELRERRRQKPISAISASDGYVELWISAPKVRPGKCAPFLGQRFGAPEERSRFPTFPPLVLLFLPKGRSRPIAVSVEHRFDGNGIGKVEALLHGLGKLGMGALCAHSLGPAGVLAFVDDRAPGTGHG